MDEVDTQQQEIPFEDVMDDIINVNNDRLAGARVEAVATRNRVYHADLTRRAERRLLRGPLARTSREVADQNCNCKECEGSLFFDEVAWMFKKEGSGFEEFERNMGYYKNNAMNLLEFEWRQVGYIEDVGVYPRFFMCALQYGNDSLGNRSNAGRLWCEERIDIYLNALVETVGQNEPEYVAILTGIEGCPLDIRGIMRDLAFRIRMAKTKRSRIACYKNSYRFYKSFIHWDCGLAWEIVSHNQTDCPANRFPVNGRLNTPKTEWCCYEGEPVESDITSAYLYQETVLEEILECIMAIVKQYLPGDENCVACNPKRFDGGAFTGLYWRPRLRWSNVFSKGTQMTCDSRFDKLCVLTLLESEWLMVPSSKGCMPWNYMIVQELLPEDFWNSVVAKGRSAIEKHYVNQRKYLPKDWFEGLSEGSIARCIRRVIFDKLEGNMVYKCDRCTKACMYSSGSVMYIDESRSISLCNKMGEAIDEGLIGKPWCSDLGNPEKHDCWDKDIHHSLSDECCDWHQDHYVKDLEYGEYYERICGECLMDHSKFLFLYRANLDVYEKDLDVGAFFLDTASADNLYKLPNKRAF